jgi:hypothetical protein
MGRTERAHAVGDNIHGAPFHTAAEEGAELLMHLGRVDPVVGGAGIPFLLGADESALFDTGDIVWMGMAPETVGALQRDKGSFGDHFGSEAVVFFIGTVAKVDARGTAKGRDFLNPFSIVHAGRSIVELGKK